MTNPAIEIGSRMTVKEGRYKGRLVEVLEVKDASARCKFLNLSEKDIQMQRANHDFEPTWFGLEVLEPEVPGATSTRIAETETSEGSGS